MLLLTPGGRLILMVAWLSSLSISLLWCIQLGTRIIVFEEVKNV
jgi:hypothetical protein